MPRKTQPYEIVRSLFNRPDLPPIRLYASASLSTVIHSWLESPDTVAVELVADLAGQIAQSNALS